MPTIVPKIAQLGSLRNQMQSLEQQISAQLRKALADLPAAYGFSSASDFCNAVLAAQGVTKRKKSAKGKRGPGRPKKAVKVQRRRASVRRRARITDEVRGKVLGMLGSNLPAKQVAEAAGVSISSVALIRKAAKAQSSATPVQ